MLHSHTDYTPGRKGATRASYDPENPMLLVRKLWVENKTADLEEIQRLVRRALGVSKDRAVSAFVNYATANLVERIKSGERDETPIKPRPKSTLSPRDKEARKAAAIALQAKAAAEAATIYNAVKDAWYLEQVAPNGKAIGDCTGCECSQFSGYYKAIGNGVGPDQKVRDVKSGTDIKNAQTWAA